jgi:hypothetical protein
VLCRVLPKNLEAFKVSSLTPLLYSFAFSCYTVLINYGTGFWLASWQSVAHNAMQPYWKPLFETWPKYGISVEVAPITDITTWRSWRPCNFTRGTVSLACWHGDSWKSTWILFAQWIVVKISKPCTLRTSWKRLKSTFKLTNIIVYILYNLYIVQCHKVSLILSINKISRRVAGLIPDEVIRFLNWRNFFCRT